MSWARFRQSLSSQRGSIAPLGLGFFVFSLAFGLTTVSATSIYIFQKRLTTLAESTAIFVASGEGDATDFIYKVGKPNFENLKVSNTLAVDEFTVHVNVCALWRAPIITVEAFAQREICSRASARSGE